jgi:hypothetical protein
MAEDLTPTTPTPQAGLLERLLDEAENAARPATGSPPTSDSPPIPPPATGDTPADIPPPPAGNPLGLLLQNPALLSALPSLMENLSPLLSGLGRGTGSSPNAARPHAIDRHTALLCAIKPYLSPHRRETAETVIRLCKVWDALERSGISLTGLLGSVGGAPTPPSEGRDDRVQ